MNISVGGVIDIQLNIKTGSSCGSEIYCAWSSIIHRKSGSIKHSRDITNGISPLTVRFLPVTATSHFILQKLEAGASDDTLPNRVCMLFLGFPVLSKVCQPLLERFFKVGSLYSCVGMISMLLSF